MDDQEKTYYENYFTMFSSEGWKQLMVDTESMVKDMKDKAFNSDEDNFYMCRGAVEQAKRLFHFEHIMRSSYDLIKEDQDDSL